jgi:regulatory protein
MMEGEITALRQQKRRTDRANVYIDGEYAFSLQGVVAAKLRVGQVVTRDEVEALQADDAAEMAYERCLRYLSYRARSTEEVRRYLRRKDVSEEVTEGVIERLERAHLLDDASFALEWVGNRETFRPRSRFALTMELRQKGVASRFIEEAVQGLDERASAMRAADRKAQQLSRYDRETFCKRLLSYLARRGFGYGIARGVTDELWARYGHKGDEQDNLTGLGP